MSKHVRWLFVKLIHAHKKILFEGIFKKICQKIDFCLNRKFLDIYLSPTLHKIYFKILMNLPKIPKFDYDGIFLNNILCL